LNLAFSQEIHGGVETGPLVEYDTKRGDDTGGCLEGLLGQEVGDYEVGGEEQDDGE